VKPPAKGKAVAVPEKVPAKSPEKPMEAVADAAHAVEHTVSKVDGKVEETERQVKEKVPIEAAEPAAAASEGAKSLPEVIEAAEVEAEKVVAQVQEAAAEAILSEAVAEAEEAQTSAAGAERQEEAESATSATAAQAEPSVADPAVERREAAMDALLKAMDQEDYEALSQALDAAKAAGIVDGTEIHLAESLCAPLRMPASFAELEKLLHLPQEFRGLDEAQVEAAERERCQGMNREQLEARVVELTRLLAMGRLHAKARVEQALLTHVEAVDAASLQSLGKALTCVCESFDKASEASLAELKAELRQQQEAAVAQATAEAQAEGQKILEAEQEAIMAAAQATIQEASGERLAEVVSLSSGLQSLEKVLAQDEAVVQRSRAFNSLSAALLCLEDAVLANRGAKAELQALRRAAAEVDDAFVTNLLSSMPAAAAQLCHRASPVPTEPVLRQSLSAKLGDLASAALVPPGRGLLGEVIGKVFSFMYVLDGEPTGVPQDSEVSKNLLALGRARRAAASGSHAQLREALEDLEVTLRGTCQERAGPAWLDEARATLQLRQTLSAVKARVQCLRSTLL